MNKKREEFEKYKKKFGMQRFDFYLTKSVHDPELIISNIDHKWDDGPQIFCVDTLIKRSKDIKKVIIFDGSLYNKIEVNSFEEAKKYFLIKKLAGV